MAYVFIITVSVVIVVAVARWRRPVGPITAIILGLLTGAWIWANLRDSGWQEVWNEEAPEGLDPVTRALFYRGWPLAPFMFCLSHGMRFRPDGLEGWVLVLDGLLLFLVLCITRFVSERYFPRRDRGTLGRNEPHMV